MRKWFNTLMLVAIGTSAPYLSAFQSDATAEVIIGYRQDNSRWSFKAPVDEQCLFKISNSLDQIHIFEVGLAASTIVDCSIYLRGQAKWGWVLDGDFRQKIQFFTPLLTPGAVAKERAVFDTSHVDSLVDGRYTIDLGLGIGYPFYFCDCTVKFIPVVGYAYQEQNYRVEQNERLSFEPPTTTTTAFLEEDESENSLIATEANSMVAHQVIIIDNDHADTKFVSRWWGPWIGFDFQYNPYLCWNLWGQFEWHFAQFKGKVQSQTGVVQFDSLNTSTHNADGFVFRVGGNYELCQDWILGVYAFYEDWSANKKARVSCDPATEVEEPILEALAPGQKFRIKNKHHGYGFGLTLGTHF